MSELLQSVQETTRQIIEQLERLKQERAAPKKLTLNGKYPSPCCGKPTIIVRSRPGGFVTQNCSQCGLPKSIRLEELPALTCTRCQVALVPFKPKNYFYACPRCKVQWELASLIPPWHELFNECGYYLDSDGVTSGYNNFVNTTAILASIGRA
jgi:hypothetical protein